MCVEGLGRGEIEREEEKFYFFYFLFFVDEHHFVCVLGEGMGAGAGLGVFTEAYLIRNLVLRVWEVKGPCRGGLGGCIWWLCIRVVVVVRRSMVEGLV